MAQSLAPNGPFPPSVPPSGNPGIQGPPLHSIPLSHPSPPEGTTPKGFHRHTKPPGSSQFGGAPGTLSDLPCINNGLPSPGSPTPPNLSPMSGGPQPFQALPPLTWGSPSLPWPGGLFPNHGHLHIPFSFLPPGDGNMVGLQNRPPRSEPPEPMPSSGLMHPPGFPPQGFSMGMMPPLGLPPIQQPSQMPMHDGGQAPPQDFPPQRGLPMGMMPPLGPIAPSPAPVLPPSEEVSTGRCGEAQWPLKTYDEAVRNIRKTEDEVQAMADGLISQISDTMQKFIAAIKRKERDLIGDISTISRETIMALQEQTGHIMELKKVCDLSCDNAKRAVLDCSLSSVKEVDEELRIVQSENIPWGNIDTKEIEVHSAVDPILVAAKERDSDPIDIVALPFDPLPVLSKSDRKPISFTSRSILDPSKHFDFCRALSVSADGSCIALAGDRSLYFWERDWQVFRHSLWPLHLQFQ